MSGFGQLLSEIFHGFLKFRFSAEHLSKLDRAILCVFSAAPTTENASIAVLRGLQCSEVVVDGGATIHGSPLRTFCFDFEPCSMNVAGLTGNSFVCLEKAKVRFLPSEGGKAVTFTNVHISEKFPATFISESVLAKAGCCIIKKNRMGMVYAENGTLLFKLTLRNGLYLAEGEFVQSKANLKTVSTTLPDEDCSPRPGLRGAFNPC